MEKKRSEAKSVIPFYLTSYDGLFMSVQALNPKNEAKTDETLSALQSMVKAMEKGGKMRFRVIKPTKNEEGEFKPNAWLEFYTPEQVEKSNAAFAAKKKQRAKSEDDLDI